jgi:hypothetical protein
VTDSLVLQRTQVTAGTPIKATLIVTYRGRAPVNLTHGCRPPMPPLPAGQYEAVLVGDGLPLPAPAPVPVILAAAH